MAVLYVQLQGGPRVPEPIGITNGVTGPLFLWLSKWVYDMGVSKNSGFTQNGSENNGKAYFLMDDLGGNTHYFRKHPYNLG